VRRNQAGRCAGGVCARNFLPFDRGWFGWGGRLLCGRLAVVDGCTAARLRVPLLAEGFELGRWQGFGDVRRRAGARFRIGEVARC